MKDIILNPNFSLKTKNGDFVIGDPFFQHLKIALITQKGESKKYPKIGIGTINFLNDNTDNLAELERSIVEFLTTQ